MITLPDYFGACNYKFFIPLYDRLNKDFKVKTSANVDRTVNLLNATFDTFEEGEALKAFIEEYTKKNLNITLTKPLWLKLHEDVAAELAEAAKEKVRGYFHYNSTGGIEAFQPFAVGPSFPIDAKHKNLDCTILDLANYHINAVGDAGEVYIHSTLLNR